jgi:hypothetical protein
MAEAKASEAGITGQNHEEENTNRVHTGDPPGC